jgi:phage shock protein A
MSRIWDKMKGWLGAVMAPAEDPRQLYTYRHQHDSLVKVQNALSAIAAARERLATKTDVMRDSLSSLERQAEQALTEGKEDLARYALQRRVLAAAEIQSLEDKVSNLAVEQESLSLVEQRLSAEIETLLARQEIAAVQYSAAEAQAEGKQAMTGISKELADLGAALEEAERRTAEMQARATVVGELVESDLAALGTKPVGVQPDPDVVQAAEEELESLKKRIEPK